MLRVLYYGSLYVSSVCTVMADEIITYRTNNGLFHSVSDLDNVKGIGEKRMETLKDLVVVR